MKLSARAVRENSIRFAVGFVLTFTCLSLYLLQPGILQIANQKIYDVFMRSVGGGEPSPIPAFVDIDEKSLETFGQWPWPRHLVGKLVENLTEAGARSIGLDIVFAEPDNSSLKSLQKSFQEHFNQSLTFNNIPESWHDNDLIFAKILAKTPSVLGAYVRFSGPEAPLVNDLPVNEAFSEFTPPKAIPPKTNLIKGRSLVTPIRPLALAAPLGIINIAPDLDGIVRSVPLVMAVGEDRLAVSLSLRTLMRALGQKNLVLKSGPRGLTTLQVKPYRIPVTIEGRFILPFRGGSGYYPTFSAADILLKKIPTEDLRGRIFIVGTSSTGLLDIRATPFDPIYPGAEIHVATLDAILSNRSITIPPWEKGFQCTTIIAIGILGTLFFSLTPPIVYLPLLLLLIGGTLGGSWAVFQEEMIYFSPLYTTITIIALAIFILGVRFYQESGQKKVLRTAFNRYLAPDMVAAIVDKGGVTLSGEERQITVMFTDIRKFTTIAESLNPEEVVNILNRYFTPMTAIIRQNRGTVSKFIGDAIMAFWNAPLDIPQHQAKAVNAAQEMLTALADLNRDFKESWGLELDMGIGLHTGSAYVGIMGSVEMLDYTCIGDTINLASRLESLCPLYGFRIILSAQTAKLALDSTCEAGFSQNGVLASSLEGPCFLILDSIQVKGKRQAVEICTFFTTDERKALAREIESFISARNLYSKGDFNQAASCFADFIAKASDDSPFLKAAELFKERSTTLAQTPPQSWNGVWVLVSK